MFRALRSKKFSLFLAIVFMLSIMVPFAGAATYSPVGSGMPATAGQDNQLGTARIVVPAANLQVNDWVDIKLPSDFKFFSNAGPAQPAFAPVGTNTLSNGNIDFVAPVAGNALTDAAGSQLVTEFTVAYRDDNRLRLTYIGPGGVWHATNTDVTILIRLNTAYVDSGFSGDIKLEFASAPGMAFSSGSVVVGSVGVGAAKIAISEVNTRNSSGGAIGDITITEDRPGALSATANSIKLKLPSGVTWRPASVTAATTLLEYGDAVAVLPNSGPAAADLTRDASGRELIIPFNATAGTGTTTATSFTIQGLAIDFDETKAKTGDIEVSIGGDSTITPSSMVVAKYAEFGIKRVEAFDEPKEVRAGRMDEEVGKIVIEEAIGDSLIAGRTITLTLVGGAKWNTPPRQDTTNSRNYDLTAFTAVGTDGEVVRATVGANTSRAVLVLEKASVDVSAASLAGDIKVVVGGTAGATGEVVVAKIVKPVTASVEGAVPNVKIGTSAQPIAPIIITENAKEAIDDAAGANTLTLEFFPGVIPSLPTSVTVEDGDVDLNKSLINRAPTADGRWQINIPVSSSSYKASKIKVDGIKVTTDRTVPEGPMAVSIKGNALVQTTALFPGATAVGSVVVANVVSKVEGGDANAAAFVIGSTTYTLNGTEMTMDVAPYVKDGRTYLPIRYVATALGVADNNILWDSATGTVTLLKGDKVVQVVVGSKTMTVNGASIAMDVAPEIKDGRTMLPFRWIAWAFNADVEWDAATQTVNMKL